MSELERVGRLPVFIDEEQWSAAFQAAKETAEVLFGQGKLDVPTGHPVNATLAAAAVEIATAALRAASQEDTGDVTDLPGVSVARIDEIGSHTDKSHPPFTVSENVTAVQLFDRSEGGKEITYPQ